MPVSPAEEGVRDKKQDVLRPLTAALQGLEQAKQALLAIHPLAQDTDSYKQIEKQAIILREIMASVMKLRLR